MPELVKPCPFCGSEQIQVCVDYNNLHKSFAKCRTCRAQAPITSWGKRVKE